MAIETAAAILTRLAFEQNINLRSKLSIAPADETTLVALLMPLFRGILFQLQEDQRAYDEFPSGIEASPSEPGH
jgi:hypothetical protein